MDMAVSVPIQAFNQKVKLFFFLGQIGYSLENSGYFGPFKSCQYKDPRGFGSTCVSTSFQPQGNPSSNKLKGDHRISPGGGLKSPQIFPNTNLLPTPAEVSF